MESENTIEYAGPETRTKRNWKWVLRAFLAVAVVLFVAVIGYEFWPTLVLEPAMRAEASQDVLMDTNTVTPRSEEGESFPISRVVVANEQLRFRAVSSSHHNMYGYHGSTYVNVNNQLYYLPSGHCDPSFDSPVPLTLQTTEKDFTNALIKEGYKWIGRVGTR